MSWTPSFEMAAEYAAWWTRVALDLAANAEGMPPGVVGHLTAAQSQHRAVEQLMKSDLETVSAL